MIYVDIPKPIIIEEKSCDVPFFKKKGFQFEDVALNTAQAMAEFSIMMAFLNTVRFHNAIVLQKE